MSVLGEAGLSINVSTPIVRGQGYIQTLVDAVTTYSHDISAPRGFDSSDLTVAVGDDEIGEWVNEGLGRDVTVRNAAGAEVWSGFVNTIDIRQGARTMTIGPLVDIANRIAILFGEVDHTADPPPPPLQTITTYAEDSASQDDYGVWEKVINGGNRTRAEANQIRDAQLNLLAFPDTSKELATGGGMPSVRLDCLGYWAWLQAFTYNDAAQLSTTISGKILLVMAAAELANSGVISTDYGLIGDNDVLAYQFEDKYRTGLAVIEDVVKYGDENYDRWTFGVYEGRQAIFDIVPDTIKYVNRRGDGDLVKYRKGGEVMPWDVRPVEWLAFADIVVGAPLPQTRAGLYSDLRTEFIERVQYTAPYSLSLNGQRINSARQALAQMGIGGA